MKVYSFKRKKSLNIFSLLTVLLGMFIVFGMNQWNIGFSYVYLFVSVFSYIYVRKSAKKARERFEKIVVNEREVTFYFENKLKEKLVMQVSDVCFKNNEEAFEIQSKGDKELVGKGLVSSLTEKELFTELRMQFDNCSTLEERQVD
ncbi:hypothetical protein [Owenweeksia hongkongensis]|uniref:hypothetical protein n=1 Tax=Owenweeksia hongkongensis TaxID=253245 RepID=UPI003A958741